MMAFIIWARKNRSLVFHIVSVLTILLLLVGMYCKGSYDAKRLADREMALRNAQAALLLAQADAAAARLEAQQTKVTTQVVTKYVDRVKVIHQKAATIIQEVPKYVTQADDRRCTIPTGFVKLWDMSNAGSSESYVPETTGDPDERTPGSLNLQVEEVTSDITLSDIAQQHAIESEYTLSIEEQLRALQEWVREQEKLSLTP